MYLQKIEIYGFKSFAEKTKIDFKNGITAIVGPNGSGKSNIVDSIRWVLGEQSMKSLRGQKSEDIIFGGTEFRKKLGFAEVSIFFSNEDGFFNIDFKNIKITRKIYRNGESEYLINDSKVKLKDVQTLLMGTGIGKDGYSIIGQGRIDEILSSSGEDRKKIFEEAAGIMKFKMAKKEAEKKLEKTDINLIRIRDILSEINENLNTLYEKQKKAKEYLTNSRKLKDIETRIFLKSLNEIKEKKDLNDKIKKDFEESIKSLNAEKEKLTKEKEKLNNLEIEYSEKIEKYTVFSSEKQKQKANLEKDIIVKKEYIKNGRIELENLEKEILELKKQIKTQEEEYNIKYNKYLKYLNESKEFEKKYLEKKNLLEEKITKMSVNEKEIIENKEQIDKNIDDIYNIKNKILINETTLEHINSEILKNENLEREYISNLDFKRQEMNEFINSNKEISIKKEEETKKLNILNNKVDESKIKIEKLETEKKELITLNSALNGRLNLLKVMEEQNENYSFAIKKILEETNKNKEFKNLIEGVIVNLIKTDKKYTTAFEIALGFSLQNIVVENKENARKLIKYLKENNFGRATFLPLDSIHNTKTIEYKNFPNGIIGFAKDLLQYDKKYENIINYLLGKTVIAENLSAAIDFSNKDGKNFKIVTLDGDLINPSGSMSGGSVNKSKVGILSRKDEIKELEDRINKNENKIKKLESISINEDNNLKNLRILRSNYYKTYNKSSVEYAIFEEKQNKINDDINKFEENLNKIRKDIKENKDRLEQIKKENDELINKKEEKEKEIKKLEEIVKISSNKEEKEKINNLKDEVTDLKISFSSFKDSVDSSLEMANLIKEQIEKNIDSKDKKEEKKEKLNSNILNEENNIKNIFEKIQNYGDLSKENEEEISKIKECIKENKEKLEENEKKLKNNFEEIINIEKKKDKLDLEFSKLEFEREKIIENMWENYEITPQSNINLPEEEYKNINLEEKVKEIKELKQKIKEIGPVDVSSIDEYIKTKERKEFLETQEKDMLLSIKEIKKAIENLVKAMTEEFNSKFSKIKENFENVFKEFFSGGKATISLEDKNDPLNSEIEIKAQPPGKKLQSMMLLSGGERTLTAIALLFAILKTNPSPICVLDEIEAALDDINIDRFTKYLKSYANKNIQFLIITHRKGTMEAAETVYGATMEEKGITKLVSLELKK